MSGASLLQASKVEVLREGRRVLEVDALDVRPGDILALIGPNGAGKTTLLHVLASLLKPARGQISFRGQVVNSRQAELLYRRRLAMVFQEPLLFSTTVFDNVATGLKLRGVPRNRIRELVALNLDRFGIGHLARRSARQISGGEAQRTSLARALATEPEILFLDEPFSALDPLSREGLIEDLDNVLRDARITTVLTTHDHGEALRLASRMAVMEEGRIVQLDRPENVFHQPVNAFVAQFVGVENLLRARVVAAADGRMELDAGGWRLYAEGGFAAGSAVLLCVRPECVAVLPDIGAGIPAHNVRSGRVSRIIPLGHCCRILVDCQGCRIVSLVAGHGGALSAGAAVTLHIPPETLHVIGDAGEAGP